MLARQVGADDLRTGIGRGQIDPNPFPSTLPIRIGKEAAQHLGIEIALAVEVAVESAAGQPRVGHDGIDRDAFESASIEQAARALHDSLANALAMAGWIRRSEERRVGKE